MDVEFVLKIHLQNMQEHWGSSTCPSPPLQSYEGLCGILLTRNWINNGRLTSAVLIDNTLSAWSVEANLQFLPSPIFFETMQLYI